MRLLLLIHPNVVAGLAPAQQSAALAALTSRRAAIGSEVMKVEAWLGEVQLKLRDFTTLRGLPAPSDCARSFPAGVGIQPQASRQGVAGRVGVLDQVGEGAGGERDPSFCAGSTELLGAWCGG